MRRFTEFSLVFLVAAMIASLARITDASAQSGHPTWVDTNFRECLAKPGPHYMAWVPEAFTWCLWNGPTDPADGLARAIQICTAKIPVSWRRANVRCIAAYDGNGIVDPKFRTSLTTYRPIPYKLKIFDAKTGKLQTGRAVVRRAPTSKRDIITLEIVADGLKICSGNHRLALNVDSATYTVTCFGETWTSQTEPFQFARSGEYYFYTPKHFRLEKNGSYIDLRL